ncbi:sterile alpha motif domain-containing protein 9-like [Eucyclogobius newberryi]|uniref:sterile alpha motif domain-containing protein 9-like n=1 Tax=Eucyclogobius newberryi TaxID=166745 RepID=UPI003B597DDA
MEDWSKEQVRDWALKLRGVDPESAEILFNQNITGTSLKRLHRLLIQMGLKFGPAEVIIHAKNGMREAKLCDPFPVSDRYIEGDILSVAESGAADLIEFCHEFKSFINTTDGTKMEKFQTEVIRFAAACLNRRTNGTIHFGILDKPHGKICGAPVDSNEKESYDQALMTAIKDRFSKHQHIVQKCIKRPRFIEVLNKDLTPTGKFVIEVDVVPHDTMCKTELFHTSPFHKSKTKQFFVREGSSSRNLLAPDTSDKKNQNYQQYVNNVNNLSELRKQAEEKNRSMEKSHKQGFKLGWMITGGSGSLDRSYYNYNLIVSNSSDPKDFFLELKPSVVWGFNYTLAETEQFHIKNISLPKKPHLFCVLNYFRSRTKRRSVKSMWAHVNAAISPTAIPSLCRDVFRNNVLVIFLVPPKENNLLSEIFFRFYKELKNTRQMLFICHNKHAFLSWSRLVDAGCKVDISDRCIYELSGAEVNGTIFSLLPEKRRSTRFLPGAGGSRVVLEKEVEDRLTTLDVLCVNQCEDKDSIEQNFYQGRPVTWENFYFAEQSRSNMFIKSEQFWYIVNTFIPELYSRRKACVLLKIKHEPGCGGTTLAKQILWYLRETYRCAVLKNNIDNEPETVAEQVVMLLKCGYAEQKPPVPVLLMIDDFGDKYGSNLIQVIEKHCQHIIDHSRFPQVILLNCIRSTLPSGPFDPTEDTVFIKHKIFETPPLLRLAISDSSSQINCLRSKSL